LLSTIFVAHIGLLAEDLRTVVATWRFRNVVPVNLTYPPLLAKESNILFETVELSFSRMEML
jgi:hypothetical protein